MTNIRTMYIPTAKSCQMHHLPVALDQQQPVLNISNALQDTKRQIINIDFNRESFPTTPYPNSNWCFVSNLLWNYCFCFLQKSQQRIRGSLRITCISTQTWLCLHDQGQLMQISNSANVSTRSSKQDTKTEISQESDSTIMYEQMYITDQLINQPIAPHSY